MVKNRNTPQVSEHKIKIYNNVLQDLYQNLIFDILFVQLMRLSVASNPVHLSTLFSKDGQVQKHPSSLGVDILITLPKIAFERQQRWQNNMEEDKQIALFEVG